MLQPIYVCLYFLRSPRKLKLPPPTAALHRYAMEVLYAIFHDRHALRRERRFRDRLDPLALSDEELIRHYRFPRRELIQLIKTFYGICLLFHHIRFFFSRNK